MAAWLLTIILKASYLNYHWRTRFQTTVVAIMGVPLIWRLGTILWMSLKQFKNKPNPPNHIQHSHNRNEGKQNSPRIASLRMNDGKELMGSLWQDCAKNQMYIWYKCTRTHMRDGQHPALGQQACLTSREGLGSTVTQSAARWTTSPYPRPNFSRHLNRWYRSEQPGAAQDQG